MPTGHPAPVPAQQPQATGSTNVLAILSLIASVLGLVGVIPLIGAILGIVFGTIARNDIARNPVQRGKELAQWGIILGIVGLVLWALIVLFMIFMFVFFTGAAWWWFEAFMNEW